MPLLIMPLLLLIAVLQDSARAAASTSGTGLEWMPIASVLVPLVLIVAIVYLGRRTRVG